ncbi:MULTISPECIES: hypothetical protein [Thalassospira]|uniref:hypothetical protein n=1 Tax=Thalassospira TaxID=168934 RepID=UPI000B1AB42A|nr:MULTISPECIES: hypothetical protein [Thalassospira]MDM7976695.1 hypothetical protein [Thalassospira xiamenensis]
MVDPSLSFDGGALLDGIGGPCKPDDFILTFLLTETVGAGMFSNHFGEKVVPKSRNVW